MPATILSTARLALRATEPDDFDLLFANVFSDEHVMEHLGGSPLLPKEARALFDAAFDHEGTGRKLGVLVEHATEQVIGYAGLLECLALGEKDYELGFVLSRSAWGRGFATEIGHAQVEYGFGLARCRRLLAQVAPKNHASASALRKIGMQFHSEYERPGRGIRHLYVRNREA